MFKQRKNKRFNYKPRHTNEEAKKKETLEAQWQRIKIENKRKTTVFNSISFLILVLIAVLVLSYILGSYE